MKTHTSHKKLSDDIEFLISRKDLLDHISATENILKEKVSKHKAREPFYQERLIEEYLSFEVRIRELKSKLDKMHTKNERGTLSVIAGEKTQKKHVDADVQNGSGSKKMMQELKTIEHDFNVFLSANGFKKI